MSTLTHQHVKTNGISLHTVQAGPEDGPLLIFLHGFPEFWYCWHRQIDFFAERGFRVVVPDQRGYNLSPKPSSISSYRVEPIARDILGLIESLGRRKAHIVGHDWGGITAWRLGNRYKQWVERLAILNCPHPGVMRRNLFSNPAQLKKSWYIFYYQLPWLPEWTMSRNDWEFARKALQYTSVRGTFGDDDLGQYVAAWSQPGALSAMLGWYRAGMLLMKSRIGKRRPPRKIEVPTLLLWGAKDRFLGREMAQPSVDRCTNGRLIFLEEATHWLQHEEPEKVNSLLLQFLTS
ncbi:MAG: alpha/beta hydrolase [Candidatus Marinimicrobia bacterium]|nr:alpha/beta hydrolase [Candidatus Neomarinimicrobiota bacterium]MDP6457395.1 alpha/beta hydrolase [Candidatus Neomarinimicrobiota bacterium]